jgi:hypothetical protein
MKALQLVRFDDDEDYEEEEEEKALLALLRAAAGASEALLLGHKPTVYYRRPQTEPGPTVEYLQSRHWTVALWKGQFRFEFK